MCLRHLTTFVCGHSGYYDERCEKNTSSTISSSTECSNLVRKESRSNRFCATIGYFCLHSVEGQRHQSAGEALTASNRLRNHYNSYIEQIKQAEADLKLLRGLKRTIDHQSYAQEAAYALQLPLNTLYHRKRSIEPIYRHFAERQKLQNHIFISALSRKGVDLRQPDTPQIKQDPDNLQATTVMTRLSVSKGEVDGAGAVQYNDNRLQAITLNSFGSSSLAEFPRVCELTIDAETGDRSAAIRKLVMRDLEALHHYEAQSVATPFDPNTPVKARRVMSRSGKQGRMEAPDTTVLPAVRRVKDSSPSTSDDVISHPAPATPTQAPRRALRGTRVDYSGMYAPDGIEEPNSNLHQDQVARPSLIVKLPMLPSRMQRVEIEQYRFGSSPSSNAIVPRTLLPQEAMIMTLAKSTPLAPQRSYSAATFGEQLGLHAWNQHTDAYGLSNRQESSGPYAQNQWLTAPSNPFAHLPEATAGSPQLTPMKRVYDDEGEYGSSAKRLCNAVG